MSRNIELSLTLYALSAEYVHGKLTLEGCLAKAKEMGYSGIEMVASQMVPEYPYPSEVWMDGFVALLGKYGLKPVCYSAYIDMGTHSDRDLTEDEIFQSTLNDMIYAKRMGFQMVRTQHAISPAIFRRMLPYAKRIGIILSIEMHHPHTPEVPVWKEYFKIIDQSGGYLGMVPDFSIFAEHPHALFIEQMVSDFGCRKDKVDEIIRLHAEGKSREDILKGDYTDAERRCVDEVFHNYGSGAAHLEWLDEILPRTVYIHGKFWHMDGEEDTCVPTAKIIPLIKKSGYTGYIASEYEGHHFLAQPDTETQLRRWVAMTNRLLDAE